MGFSFPENRRRVRKSIITLHLHLIKLGERYKKELEIKSEPRVIENLKQALFEASIFLDGEPR